MTTSKNFLSPDFSEKQEKLLRAVRMKPNLWKDGRLSSAAFKDKRGVSVDRVGGRAESDAIEDIRKNLEGAIVAVTVEFCQNQAHACLKYKPTLNPYHSEIHGSETSVPLSPAQAHQLAQAAQIIYKPSSANSSQIN